MRLETGWLFVVFLCGGERGWEGVGVVGEVWRGGLFLGVVGG